MLGSYDWERYLPINLRRFPPRANVDWPISFQSRAQAASLMQHLDLRTRLSGMMIVYFSLVWKRKNEGLWGEGRTREERRCSSSSSSSSSSSNDMYILSLIIKWPCAKITRQTCLLSMMAMIRLCPMRVHTFRMRANIDLSILFDFWTGGGPFSISIAMRGYDKAMIRAMREIRSTNRPPKKKEE